MQRSRTETEQGKRSSVAHRVGNVVGVVLCLLLLPILCINITLIAKSYLRADQVPDVGGILPLIVLTDSMDPEIRSGDLILCHTADPASIGVGDVIAFFDPAGSGSSIVTHRVIEVLEEEGSILWRTQGDANNAADAALVPAENLVGLYRSRLPGVGSVAMFLQSTAGLVICVAIPLAALIAYDLLRRRSYEKRRRQDTDALQAELERLRAERLGAQTPPPTTDVDGIA